MKTIPLRQIFSINLFILTLGFILTANLTFSQDYEMTRINNHSSPEAAGAKVGGAGSSVDMFRGTLNTSIPIHNYVGREMNLPISLSYSATGIKVDQVASNVGLGWNLNVGGRITKVVSVSSDNSYTNNINPPFMDNPYQMCGRDAIEPGFEFPDFYRVTAMGFEDVIQYDENVYGRIQSIINPFHEVSVSNATNMRPRENASFTIVNEKEEEYYFGGGNSEVTIINSSGSGNCQNINEKSTTSWLLTKVVSSNKLDVYEFEYQNFIWAIGSDIENNGEGYTVGVLPGVGNIYHLLQTKYRMNQQMIKRIFHNGKKIIEFNYDNRDDLVVEGGQGNRLTSIDFFNFNENSIYKRVNFSYSYFGNASSSSFLDKRLKLESVSFSGTAIDNTSLIGDEYSFTYYAGQTPTEMPSLTSYARDYLGLYNGRIDNVNLVINGIQNLPGGIYNVNPPNSQRSYEHEKALIGTLESITNPTKGKTIFQYEQNALSGGYGTVSVQGATYEVENTLVNHINDEVYCTALPDQYTSINSAFDEPLDLHQFDDYDGNERYGLVLNVQTTVLDLTNQDINTMYHFDISGHGIYMIQKIPTCSLPSLSYPGCINEVETIPVFDGCLVPTQNIFYNGLINSHPQDLIAGGLTNYSPTIEPRNLEPGKYQITTWLLASLYENWSQPPVKVRVYKIDQVTPPPHDENLDVTTNYIDGFRIKSITNLDANSNFVSKKAYKYKLGGLVDYVNNLKETNYGSSIGRQRLSRGYVNAPEIVHYHDVFEVDLDRDDHDNGYVEYKLFSDNAEIVPFEYSNDPREPARITAYDYAKNGMITEKNIFNKEGDLVFKESYDFEPDYYMGYGSFDPFPITYYKLIRIESTNYFNANSSITKVQNFDEYLDNRLYHKAVDDEGFNYYYDDSNPTSYTYRIARVDSDRKGDTRFNYSQREGVMYGQSATISRRLLTEIQHAKHGEQPLPITQFEYDTHGNKVQTKQFTDGDAVSPTGVESYVYGYNNSLPIAKLSGVLYSEIQAIQGSNWLIDVKEISDRTVSDLNAQALRNKLAELRTLFPNALITTYTYNPVYGVTSVTDPKGYTIFSEYDALGRLIYTKERVPDPNGQTSNDQINTLSKNEYHTLTN